MEMYFMPYIKLNLKGLEIYMHEILNHKDTKIYI